MQCCQSSTVHVLHAGSGISACYQKLHGTVQVKNIAIKQQPVSEILGERSRSLLICILIAAPVI